MLDLEAIRHHLHQHPELSGAEKNTQTYLREKLEAVAGVTVSTVGKTGLLATIEGAAEGPGLLLRADIDALPIAEQNPELSYKSQNEGVAHKCGHDGHATSLLGAVELVATKGLVKKGCLYALFQPAEETGQGAARVLEDPAFPQEKIQKAYAYHNIPQQPLGRVLFKEGTFSAGVISVAIELTGKNAHAAEPEQGRNPSGAMAEILQRVQKQEQKDPGQADFALITPVYGRFGEKAYGTAAGQGELHFTLRCWSGKRLDRLKGELEKTAEEIARQHKLKSSLRWFEEFRPTQNSPSAQNQIAEAARRAGMEEDTLSQPFRWGEDFGLFTERFEGGMYGLGSGKDQPALHNPDFDYPDALLPQARDMFVQLVELELGNG